MKASKVAAEPNTEKFIAAMMKWASAKMRDPYAEDTVTEKIKKLWRRWKLGGEIEFVPILTPYYPRVTFHFWFAKHSFDPEETRRIPWLVREDRRNDEPPNNSEV